MLKDKFVHAGWLANRNIIVKTKTQLSKLHDWRDHQTKESVELNSTRPDQPVSNFMTINHSSWASVVDGQSGPYLQQKLT